MVRRIKEKANGAIEYEAKLYIDPQGRQKVQLESDDRRANARNLIITESKDGKTITIKVM